MAGKFFHEAKVAKQTAKGFSKNPLGPRSLADVNIDKTTSSTSCEKRERCHFASAITSTTGMNGGSNER